MFLNLQPDYDVGLIFQQSVVHITMLVVVCLSTTTLSWMLILDMKDSNRGDETWDDRFSNSERFKRRSGSTTPWLWHDKSSSSDSKRCDIFITELLISSSVVVVSKWSCYTGKIALLTASRMATISELLSPELRDRSSRVVEWIIFDPIVRVRPEILIWFLEWFTRGGTDQVEE